jgi:LysR family transcriptional regulator, transcriptional activator of the cysJI operon
VILGDVRLFKEIATHKSMSKGAASCGLSQSAAIQHVQEVERKLGTILFDRGKRPLELTAAGRLYYDFCREAIRRQDELARALEELNAGVVSGTVRVASIYSMGLSEMSRLQHEFATRYPAAQLHVEYQRPDKVYESVRDDSADLGFVSYPAASRDIAAIPWRKEEMRVAVPPSHPLAAKAEAYPADLNGQDYVGFDEDLEIRRELDKFLRANGVTVNLTIHFDNIQMIKEAVALGSGISLLPARTMQAEIAQGRLVAVKLHAPELQRPVGVLHRRRKKFNAATRSFLELLLAPEEA